MYMMRDGVKRIEEAEGVEIYAFIPDIDDLCVHVDVEGLQRKPDEKVRYKLVDAMLEEASFFSYERNFIGWSGPKDVANDNCLDFHFHCKAADIKKIAEFKG